MEACAGLAAVVKSVLILESGMIPPTIHFRKGNPKIKFDEWNIQIPITLTPWPVDGLRRISTNSFGYGGTNAHAILDDAYHYLKDRGLQGNHYTKNSEYQVRSLNGVSNGVSNGVPSGVPSGPSNGLSNGGSKVNGFDDLRRPRLYVFSAQDKEGLKRVKLPLSKFLKAKSVELEDHSQESLTYLTDLAYTLSQRRSHL